MNIKKFLPGALFLWISATSVFSQEPAKNEPAVTDKKDDSSFEVKALIQVRMVTGQAKSGYATPLPTGTAYTNKTTQNDFQGADFNFRRLRLAANYQMAKWVGSTLDLKVENLIVQKTPVTDVPGSTTLQEAIVKIGGIQEAVIWFKPGFMGTTIKMGQFKLPFSRELSSSSTNHIFAEPSFVTNLIQENDIGLYLVFQPLELIGGNMSKKLDVMLSYTNGDGAADAGNGAKRAEFSSTAAPLAKLLNWRIQINPFGGLVKDGKEADWKDGEEIFSESPLWSIGVAGAYITGYEGSNTIFTTGKSLSAHTIDTTFFGYGVYVNGEYTFTSGSYVKAYQTWQASLGYAFDIGSMKLMPVVRYNYQQYDVNSNGTVEDTEKLTSIWVGANLFAIKHNLKFQLFYNINQNNVSFKDSTKPLGKDVLYFMIQSAFGKKV